MVTPVRREAKPGDTVNFVVSGHGLGPAAETGTITLRGRGLIPDQTDTWKIAPGGAVGTPWSVALPRDIPAGRHPFIVTLNEPSGVESVDAFVVIDVVNP